MSPEPRPSQDGRAHGDREAAVTRARAAVAAHPGRAEAHVQLGTALWFAGEREASMSSLRRALELDPSHPDAHNNLGNALVATGDTAAAIEHYEAALAVRPGHAETHYNLGNAYLSAGTSEQAETCYRAAIRLRPDHAGAHNNLGNILRGRGEPAEALTCYRRALLLRPDYFGTHNNVGAALLALHRPAEAAVAFEAALADHPEYAEACNNLGGALLALDRPEDAITWFRRATELDAGLKQAAFGEALALLSLGQFEEGWAKYERRWDDPRFREGTPEIAAPRWDGTDLGGRTILLAAEQGLGDTIQFCRYAPLVAARGGRVVLEVQPSLRALLAPLAGTVIAQGDAPPDFDVHCPLLSLPHMLGTTLATVPADVPYLRPDPSLVTAWTARLGARSRLRVGITFSGSADHSDDAIRSIGAATMLPPLRATGAELHLIQNDIRAGDAAVLEGMADVRVHAAELGDFAHTAALATLMDVVVSVDTSVAHLAGALGLRTFVLLQRNADFRWLRGRDDSPWYPTMTLFRQAEPGNWAPVLDAVSERVAGLV